MNAAIPFVGGEVADLVVEEARLVHYVSDRLKMCVAGLIVHGGEKSSFHAVA